MVGTDIHIAFWILLALFSLISCGLAMATLANVVRLRNVRMNWKAGKMKGYPLFSTIFLGFSLILMGVGLLQQSLNEMLAASLYLFMSAGWFMTSYLASKRYITDHGIVKNVNEPSQTVAWHQVRDFVEQDHKDGLTFIFLYSETESATPDNMIRLELNVPFRKVREFKKLISHKLGRRISCYANESVRIEEFE